MYRSVLESAGKVYHETEMGSGEVDKFNSHLQLIFRQIGADQVIRIFF